MNSLPFRCFRNIKPKCCLSKNNVFITFQHVNVLNLNKPYYGILVKILIFFNILKLNLISYTNLLSSDVTGISCILSFLLLLFHFSYFVFYSILQFK